MAAIVSAAVFVFGTVFSIIALLKAAYPLANVSASHGITRSIIIEDPKSESQITWRYPRADVLWDGSNRSGIKKIDFMFAVKESILDTFLVNDCLVVISPSFRWQQEKRDIMRNLTVELHGNENIALPKPSLIRSKANFHVTVPTWCLPSLRAFDSLQVTFKLDTGQQQLTLTTTVPRAEPSGPVGNDTIGACTLFGKWERFYHWVRYMHIIGVDVVYGYYNGDSSSNATLNDPFYRKALELVAQGSLVLVEWAHPYHYYMPVEQAFGTTQSSAMTSCLWRYRHLHRFTLFVDDDEMIYVNSNQTLRQWLLSDKKRDLPCVLLTNAWAAANLPNGTQFSLDALSASNVTRAPGNLAFQRSKWLISRQAAPVYLVHYHQHYEDPAEYGPFCSIEYCYQQGSGPWCTDGMEAGFLHFVDLFKHDSAGSGDWGSTADWTPTSVIRDMVDKGHAARGLTMRPARL